MAEPRASSAKIQGHNEKDLTFNYKLMFWPLIYYHFSGEGERETSIVVTPYLVPFTAATGMFFPLFLQRIVRILEFISFTLRKLKLFLAVLHKSRYQNINH